MPAARHRLAGEILSAAPYRGSPSARADRPSSVPWDALHSRGCGPLRSGVRSPSSRRHPIDPQGGRSSATAAEHPCPAGASGARQRFASAPWLGSRDGRLSVSGAAPTVLRRGFFSLSFLQSTLNATSFDAIL